MAGREGALWNAIICDIGRPQAADLVFNKGRYYLHATNLGFLIVGMTNDKSLKKIRIACANVQEKLADPTVCKRVLLKMLSEGEDMMKPHLVNALTSFADAEVAHALLPLLQQGEKFPEDVQEKLLLSLCKVLGHCATSEAIPPLKKLLETYSAITTKTGKDLETAARQAIQHLESIQPGKVRPITKENPTSSDTLENLSAGSSPEEQQIKELLGRGNKRQAIALIMQQITGHAKKKDFQRAEQLRDWLMQIDSMALTESIRAAEIIEEEKSASISNEYLSIWKELQSVLSPDEFASLYHATTQRNYADGEMVVKQGEFLPTLFFVNSGRVQINAVSQGREVPLTVLGPGEIMGRDTFFDASVWTVNAVSRGAFLSLLTWQRLQSQNENCPALPSKLQNFCLRFASLSNLFAKTSRTRRLSERKKVSGRVTIDMLDQHGNEMGLAAKGELMDISMGGVAFNLRFSKKENAAALLGQKIRVNFRPDASAAPLLRIGQVMAVRCHDFIGSDYSLHVEFESALSSAEIQLVAGKGR